MKRDCGVCGGARKKYFYSQRFVVPSANYLHSGYDVVICKDCGFAYADNLPSQSALDEHYRGSYGNSEEPERYVNSSKTILRYLRESDKILDIGCGSGHLLRLLREAGCRNVAGLDPSEVACRTAKGEYGLEVVQGSVFDKLDLDRFDFIVLNQVLEHIVDLPNFIMGLHKLLKSGGLVYIEVPDAYNFILSVEPNARLGWKYETDLFAHFAPEHINFFSMVSLENLMSRLGFERVFIESQVCHMGIVASVWRLGGFVDDPNTETYLAKYVEAATAIVQDGVNIINMLVENQEEILVWGTGLHTQRLLGCTAFRKANIRAFVDSNPEYQGKQLVGKSIVSPEELVDIAPLPILISSRRLQDEICREIAGRGLSNPLIRLYPNLL